MAEYTILGIYLSNRVNNAHEVQKVLTNFGCHIKTRLGLHPVSEEKCASFGLILLEIVGDQAEIQKFEAELKTIHGVEVKKMEF